MISIYYKLFTREKKSKLPKVLNKFNSIVSPTVFRIIVSPFTVLYSSVELKCPINEV